jgi:hypothetical protein
MPAKNSTMSASHKAALAKGREQGRVVRAYLTALDEHKPKRGRQRTPESITKRLAEIDGALSSSDPLKRVQLIQERLDLTKERDASAPNDLPELEAAFVKVAKVYGDAKGLTWAAWREVGVPAGVLVEAGISRTT